MAKKENTLTPEDRERLHQLLDYAIDNNEEYVIMQFAQMDLDFHIKRHAYRLMVRKEEDF